jgi:hypothetical protein
LAIADATIAAAIGGSASPRFWNEWQRTYDVPCAIMELGQIKEMDELDGQVGMVIADFTITCRAATETASYELWTAMRSVLAGYSGNGTFDLVLELTDCTSTPLSDGSVDCWYDKVMHFHGIYTP